MSPNFMISNLGPCRVQSPLPLTSGRGADTFRFIDDRALVLYGVTPFPGNPNEAWSFEMAGPRSSIYFDPSKTRVGIVTCGGLCPGINNVIRTIVMQMYYQYRVKYIYGFRYGYQGFIPKYGHNVLELTPDMVKDIYNMGGSILSSSRGHQEPVEIVDCLERTNINILFCIGGDGTLKGCH